MLLQTASNGRTSHCTTISTTLHYHLRCGANGLMPFWNAPLLVFSFETPAVRNIMFSVTIHNLMLIIKGMVRSILVIMFIFPSCDWRYKNVVYCSWRSGLIETRLSLIVWRRGDHMLTEFQKAWHGKPTTTISQCLAYSGNPFQSLSNEKQKKMESYWNGNYKHQIRSQKK